MIRNKLFKEIKVFILWLLIIITKKLWIVRYTMTLGLKYDC